jgi:hypothetical protein
VLDSNNFRYSNNAKEFDLDEESKRSAHKLPTDIFNKSLTKDDLTKMPFSTRSTGERPDSEIERKKKVSQSAAEETLRHYRAQNDVFEDQSE